MDVEAGQWGAKSGMGRNRNAPILKMACGAGRVARVRGVIGGWCERVASGVPILKVSMCDV